MCVYVIATFWLCLNIFVSLSKFNSVKFGRGAKAAVAAAHLILQTKFRAAAATAAGQNGGPVNLLADPGTPLLWVRTNNVHSPLSL